MAREYRLQPSPQATTSHICYEEALNVEQYAAVSSPPGRALVIAGAGSGKTRTLTYRVAWLLDHGVSAREVLLLTFTNKAAREMIERVRDLVPHDTSDLWAGTFHSIGSRILRRHAVEIGFQRSFSILDREDQKAIISSIVKSSKFETGQRRFPKADVLAGIFSMVGNTGATLEQVIADRYDHLHEWLDEIAKVQKDYHQKKQDSNSMDFDDLLVRTVRLFEEQPAVLKIYQQRFRHVLVDEYQDTNAIQGRMIELLIGSENSLMAVGDDAQSIYSWRGAEMEHILKFPERHPNSLIFTIETNYRSVPEILDLSNVAISANRARFEKNLRASRELLGVKPALVALSDPRNQAMFVGQRIEELIDEGVPLDEIAVLYRAHHQSLEIQLELTQRKIPFSITSGLRFFEQAHIKDVAAFMRLVVNPRDEVSFLRMVSLLPGCGPVGAARLWSEWLARGLADVESRPESWSEVLLQFKVPSKSAKHWEQLCYVWDELTPDGEPAAPSSMMFSILEGVYDDYLKSEYDNHAARRADIEQLSAYSGTFEQVGDFLEQLSLMGTIDGEPTGRQADDQEPKVTLTSIHQAKGLEWQAVFLIWLVDGQFPNGRILESEDQAAFEEERRLFYVAITRAKDALYLCFPMLNPKSYTGEMVCRPSRFLDDFPHDLIEEWDVSSDSAWADDPF